MADEVGSAIQLTFNTTTGADVSVAVVAPDGTSTPSPVTESPSGSGAYPFTFIGSAAGWWHVTFTAAGTATVVDDTWIYVQAVSLVPPLATADDVAGMFRPLSPAELDLSDGLIQRASALLRAQVPGIDGRIAAGTLNPLLVSTAIGQMILRVLKNPAALVQQTVGPFSVTYNKDAAAGYLYVTPEDLALLVDTSIAAPPPAGTIALATWQPSNPYRGIDRRRDARGRQLDALREGYPPGGWRVPIR